MKPSGYDMIMIGGSAGSLEVIIPILKALPADFQPPVVLVIHRLKNTTSSLDKMLSTQTGIRNIIEPEDKEPVRNGRIYLAPQNYHLMVEADRIFSLDYSAPVNFGRPSIDVSLESFAAVYGKRMMAVLLSGANKDGAAGLQYTMAHGGTALIQDPITASYRVMPEAAIQLNSSALVLQPLQIINRILNHPI